VKIVLVLILKEKMIMTEIENNKMFELCPFCGKSPVCNDEFGLCGCIEEDHVAEFEMYQEDDSGVSCAMVCKNCKACGPVSSIFKEPEDAAIDAINKWQARRVLH
jgi:hypothetical protein